VEWAWVAGESAPEPRRITDRQRNKEHELEKRPTERYRKSRMAKNGNGNLKKKKKKKNYQDKSLLNEINIFFLIEMSTGYDNLSVTQLLMLNITFPFQYLMRCWNNLDFQMTSVKRVVEYTDVTPTNLL
jgi:hypothetical protein